mgnify:CR=1 FL=1
MPFALASPHHDGPEKGKKVSNHTQAQSHEHGANCHCGHDHTHTEPCDDSDGRQEKQTLLQEGKKEAAITKAKRFTPEMQKSLWKIIVSAVLFAAATFRAYGHDRNDNLHHVHGCALVYGYSLFSLFL